MQYFEDFCTEMQPTGYVEKAVLAYLEWQKSRSGAGFVPGEDDDVDLRSYLTQLRINGAGASELEKQADALRQVYTWAQRNSLISKNPFDEYTVFLPPQVGASNGPHRQPMARDPQQYELESLRALDQITEELIRAVDMQGALDATLKTLLKVMDLPSGWISMRADTGLSFFKVEKPPDHGFVPAAAHGLPPGLEHADRFFLRRPPLCRCQRLLKEGRLTGAVNIVECSRLKEAQQENADTRSLRFHATTPLLVRGEPVGLINIASENWDYLTHEDLRFLTSVGMRLSAALERAQSYETAESRRKLLEKELKVARDVQQSLMHCEMPNIPGFQFACTWQPARHVAGDFYNIFPLDDKRWGIVIGDVADKGTAAALYMAMVQSLIMTEALNHSNPAGTLKEVNRLIMHQTSDSIYVSVFLGVFDPQSGTLDYANAGHNPPLLRKSGGSIQPLNNTGSVIGVFEDLPVIEASANLGNGEALVLYTDGLTETWRRSPEYEDYGDARLISRLESAPKEAIGILNHILADLEAFSQDEGQDDLTILVISKD